MDNPFRVANQQSLTEPGVSPVKLPKLPGPFSDLRSGDAWRSAWLSSQKEFWGLQSSIFNWSTFYQRRSRRGSKPPSGDFFEMKTCPNLENATSLRCFEKERPKDVVYKDVFHGKPVNKTLPKRSERPSNQTRFARGASHLDEGFIPRDLRLGSVLGVSFS